jgi:predicted ABC-type ATPase
LTVLERPAVVAVAGPNGAGKSTVAPLLLRETLEVTEFVNADTIARGLSGFDPQGAALAAGRIMVRRLRDLARRRVSFAFETTLASRPFVPWLRGLIREGYSFHLLFLWLPSVELAIGRVADRVRMGGQGVPEASAPPRRPAELLPAVPPLGHDMAGVRQFGEAPAGPGGVRERPRDHACGDAAHVGRHLPGAPDECY